MAFDYEVKHWRSNRKFEFLTHATEVFEAEAEFAKSLMKNLAIAAAEPDGVDDAGRQAFRLLPPEEIAERACAISEAAHRKFRERGWAVNLPSLKECAALVDPDEK